MRFVNARGEEVVVEKHGWEYLEVEKRYEGKATCSDCVAVRSKKCLRGDGECRLCQLMYEKVK